MSGKLKTIEYIGKILPDGHLSLPDEIREELDLNFRQDVRVTITVDIPHTSEEKKGWDVFRLLGRDASNGKLENASVKHDEYIYGKNR